jgi:hypothetical protein
VHENRFNWPITLTEMINSLCFSLVVFIVTKH